MVEATKRKLVKLDLAKAVEWLDKHWQGERGVWNCPICGNSEWAGEEQAMEIRPFDEGRIAAGPVIPLLVITCSTCGNTLFFNAILAGLVERPKNQ